MQNELYWVTTNPSNHITQYTQNDMSDKDGWQEVAVSPNYLNYFLNNYHSLTAQNGIINEINNSTIPNTSNDSNVVPAQKIVDATSDYQLYENNVLETDSNENHGVINSFLNKYNQTSNLSESISDANDTFINKGHLIADLNFTNPNFKPSDLGAFQSHDYQLSPKGLLLNVRQNSDTSYTGGVVKSHINLLYPGHYAETTFKVPRAIRGIDFSFWFYNISQSSDTEFDVDEINKGSNHGGVYDSAVGNSFWGSSIPTDFYKYYHTLGVKWLNNKLIYYLDGNVVYVNNHSINNAMMPIWETEVPSGKAPNYDTGWTGMPHKEDFPCHVIVKDYKIYQL